MNRPCASNILSSVLVLHCQGLSITPERLPIERLLTVKKEKRKKEGETIAGSNG